MPYRDDRAAALGDLLTQGTQLIGIAVVNGGIELHLILLPILAEADSRLNHGRQAAV